MPQPRFHGKDRFEVYVHAAKRAQFWQFVEHVEAEGRSPSEVLVDLAINYLGVKRETIE